MAICEAKYIITILLGILVSSSALIVFLGQFIQGTTKYAIKSFKGCSLYFIIIGVSKFIKTDSINEQGNYLETEY